MRDLLDDVTSWYEEGVTFALATVVRTWSSSPRGPGASMAVSDGGEVVGSVSGGCVEGAVYELAQQSWPMAGRRPRPTACPTTTPSPSA